MTGPLSGNLGSAEITAEFNTEKMAPELIAATEKAAAEAEVASKESFVKLGDTASKSSTDEFGKSFVRDVNGRLRDSRGRFVTEADKVGKAIGKKVADSTGDETTKTLGQRISNLGSLLAPKWIQSIGVWIVALGPAALQLASVLVPAVGVIAELIPAAIGGAAALEVFKVAINGVSQAIKDAGTNQAAYQKDLAKLAPSARDFVKSVVALKPELKAIGQNIQQAFFANGFSKLVNDLGRVLLPRLGNQLFYLSSTLGYLVATFGQIFTKERGASQLLTILNNFTNALGLAGDAIVPLVDGLLQIGQVASGHLLADLAGSLVNIARSFDAFVTDAYRTGRLESFFQKTYVALQQIWVIGKDAFSIVFSLLDAASKAGGGGAVIGFLTTIATVLKSLDKSGALTAVFQVFNSAFATIGKLIAPLLGPLSELILLLGKELTGDLAKLTPTLLLLVKNGIVPLVKEIIVGLPAINAFVLAIIKLLSFVVKNGTEVRAVFTALTVWLIAVKTADLLKWISGIVKGFKEWTIAASLLDVALNANIIGAFVIAIAIMIAQIAFMVMVLDKLEKKFDILGKIGNFFKGLGEDIWTFLKSAGSAIADFFTRTVPSWYNTLLAGLVQIPGKIEALLTTIAKDILFAIGVAIGGAIVTILKGPDILYQGLARTAIQISRLLAQFITDTEAALAAFAVIIYNYVTSAWSRTEKGVETFVGNIKGYIVKTFFEISNEVVYRFDQIVDFVKNLPSRIVAYGKDLFNAGAHLLSSLFAGMESIANKAGGFADAIITHIKNGLNSVITQINKGINFIGKAFPGGLPNIPHLATGAFITKPTIALIGERAPEVVLPTDDPRRAAQLLQQSGLASVLNMGTPNFNVVVKIGDRDITDIVDTQVSKANAETAAALNFGPRGS